MARRASSLPEVKFQSFQLAGGLDLVTPPLSLKPGSARDVLNFEVSITGGYTRIAGYQRFDGRPAPNDAVLQAVSLDFVDGLVVGNTISSPSAATGVVVAIDGLDVYYTKASGVFVLGDVISVGATPIGTVTNTGSRAAGLAAALYSKLAADVYRADIQAVPGSGPVRGVASYNGSKYAWRDSADGTTLGMFKATSSGWTAVAFAKEMTFDTGIAAIADGVTITGGTSGATAHVSRTVLASGSWASGDAAGRLILTTVVGTFQVGELLKVGGVTKATCRSLPLQIALQPGGRVQTWNANFGGAQSTKMYGCDGVNRGFEFDGTTYVPVATGMAADKPTNVRVHKNSLFFSFGASLQFSAIGLPYEWSAVLGAGELVVEDDITALEILPGDQTTGALGVWTAGNTYILYGTGSDSFQLGTFNTGLGAARYTVQNMEQTYQLAEAGVVGMQTTRDFGNFDADTLTLPVRPFVQQHRGRAAASGLNREKSQYRVFYSDGYGLYITINNGRCAGSMPVYFPNPVTCWCEAPSTTGAPETSFFGSVNGYVYEMDTGPNCDGAVMDWTLRLAFDAIGNSRVVKRFRKAALEVDGGSYMSFSVGYSLAYADPTSHDAQLPATYGTVLGQPFWDSMVWDNFYWDGRSIAPIEVEMSGSAENVAMQVTGSSAVVVPFTVNTITIHYSPRRTLR
jgi:hypothetical protein